MSNIESYLIGDDGLLDYLATQFGGEWNRFQLRPYPIASNNSGWGITSLSSTAVGLYGEFTLELTYTIQIGRLLGVPLITDQIQGSILAAQLDSAIARWAKCQKGLLPASASRFSGAIGLPRQNDQIPSNVQGAWWMAIVREFDLVFRSS